MALGFLIGARWKHKLQHSSSHASEAAIETPQYQLQNKVHSVFQPHSEVGQYETYLYHEDRTHLGLAKDAPAGRPTALGSKAESKIQSFPRLGGLHHRYALAA
jgi:hypothetical protein